MVLPMAEPGLSVHRIRRRFNDRIIHVLGQRNLKTAQFVGPTTDLRKIEQWYNTYAARLRSERDRHCVELLRR